MHADVPDQIALALQQMRMWQRLAEQCRERGAAQMAADAEALSLRYGARVDALRMRQQEAMRAA